MKRLTLGLPDPVWNNLAAEADARGMTIGTYVKRLLIFRDDRVSGNKPVSEHSDTEPQQDRSKR